MKNLSFLFALFMLFSNAMVAQVGINADNSAPDNSAILDVKSTDRGILIPRMTQSQRNAIASPAAGLMIYQTDNNPGFYYNSGSSGSPLWILIGLGSGWNLSGNNLTGIDFIGSTNNQPVRIFSNNYERIRVSENGNVGIGITTPVQLLSLGSTSGDAAIQLFSSGGIPPSPETNPSIGSNNPISGTVAWLTPANSFTSNDAFAQAVFSGPSSTNYLCVSGFGFAVPPYAVIKGIEVIIERNSPVSSTIQDNQVSLVKRGAITGDNKASTAFWTISDFDISYGGSSVLWGTTWTPSDINNVNFGAVISVKSNAVSIANIDHICIKVYYINDYNWTIGIDASDDNKFKVASSSTLGTYDMFSINQNGNTQFAGRVKGQDAQENDEFITKGQLASGSIPSQWATSGSIIYNTNTGWVGIGTSSPHYTLDILGSMNLPMDSSYRLGGHSILSTRGFGNLFIGKDAGQSNSVPNTTAIGDSSLFHNIIGKDNTAIGSRSLFSNTEGNYNTANGCYSLNNNTTGSENTAIGCYALVSNTQGSYNTATGSAALALNTTGIYNSAHGFYALASNTTGYQNTANGAGTLRLNTLGSNNTAIGANALFNNTEGFENTASGVGALFYNTTGWQNTAVGYRALYSNSSGQQNTASGWNALYLNTFGNNNTATGYFALGSNTTGSGNTADGHAALYANTTGHHNTAVGDSCLYNNVYGIDNTATGSRALFSNTDGNYNTANGCNSLKNNTTGSANTAIGWDALVLNTQGYFNTATGSSALASNTTGNENTAHGTIALTSNTSGERNTANGAGSLSYNTLGSNNTATGFSALGYNTDGYQNTANGGLALCFNTTGWQNTAIGFEALFSNTAGTHNTGTGSEALFNNTTGNDNTSNGWRTLYSNTTGNYNTSLGYLALYTNTTADENTAIGSEALKSNTVGGLNTAVGSEAMYFNNAGFNNTAIGAKSLFYNTDGTGNTATGKGTLLYNTTGNFNTASGYQALVSNTTGNQNSATGSQSLKSNTTGNNNVANGNNALFSNTTGSDNIAIGFEALYNNTTGNLNLALGKWALYYNSIGICNVVVGGSSQLAGDYNTAAGCGAGHRLGDPNPGGGIALAYGPDHCTFFGSNSGTEYFFPINGTNSMALGNNALVTASNQVRVGDNNIVSIGGFTNWTNISDERFKKNVVENVPGLDFIVKLRPVVYNLDVDRLSTFLHLPDSLRSKEAEIKKSSVQQSGFIAQEVEATAKSIGYDFSGVDAPKNQNDFYGIRYAEFVVPLVKAVQEQQTMIEEQQNKITNQETKIATQQLQIEELKQMFRDIIQKMKEN